MPRKQFTDEDRKTEAEIAASLNERFGYSEILAECRKREKVVILEKLRTMSIDDDLYGNYYRIKETTYHHFRTQKAALDWLRTNGCERGLKLFGSAESEKV